MTGFGIIRSPRNIIFGKGQRRTLGKLARSLGARVLICTDARLGAESDFAALVDDLKANGLAVQVFDRTVAELPVSSIEDCVAPARSFGPDLVIGVGGGSCMDLAKAVAVMLAHGGRVSDYYGEFKVPGPVLPLILIPTTSGTGSEVTPVAVLSDPERALKVGIASPHVISHTAICDPELTYSCPASLTAISGADALTHAIEAFTAIQRDPTPELFHQHVFIGKNTLSDHYALTAIARISRSLARACAAGGDEDARDDMMLGALCAGLAFGTAGTAAAHAIQYPVGALTHTPHGTGVAVLMPYVMDFNRDACIAAFAQIALAMGVPGAGKSDDDLSIAAIDAVSSLFAGIGLPKTLSDLAMPRDKIGEAAEQALSAQRLIKNNPKPVDAAALSHIITAAFDGRLPSSA